jgi:chromodomain-helicase-DNA-binding protein 1
VKWQDKAHYHSTWEDYKTAASYKGYRKLDNYYKGPVQNDMYVYSRKNADPEEYEQHMVAREAERESQLDFHVVERVIDSRDGEDETEYFVKCKSTHQPLSGLPNTLQGRD